MMIMRREIAPCREETPQPKPYAMGRGKNIGEKNCLPKQYSYGKGGEYLKLLNWKKSSEVA